MQQQPNEIMQISTKPPAPPPLQPPNIQISNPILNNEIPNPPHRCKGSMEEIANALKKLGYDKGIKRLKAKSKSLILEKKV